MNYHYNSYRLIILEYDYYIVRLYYYYCNT